MKIRLANQNRGFSLIELLLTLVLILCLAAASVFCYTSIHRQSSLDEGSDRLQSVIRFARAEAATSGRKVRLTFEAPAASGVSSTNENAGASTELRKIKVEWEPDFLKAPGVFQEYTNKGWSEELVNELVGVEKVTPLDVTSNVLKSPTLADPVPSEVADASNSPDPGLDANANESDAAKQGEDPVKEFPSITFYPDGTSDSAEIILVSLNEEDVRKLSVRLSGILGSVSSHPVAKEGSQDDADELDEAGAGTDHNDRVASSSRTVAAVSATP